MGIFTVIGRKVLSMKLQASSTQIKPVTVPFTMYSLKKHTPRFGVIIYCLLVHLSLKSFSNT